VWEALGSSPALQENPQNISEEVKREVKDVDSSWLAIF
jgi:hypothetical protein